MTDPLSQLLADGIIDEVVSRLKSGKEADIYLVQHAGEIVAAKIYKDRDMRSFRNNVAYKEGRQVRNSRTQRAMDKGSRFGQKSAEDEWKAKEFETLLKLHQAAVRVPQPVTFYEGVLLMEAVIDPEGFPAPRLIDATIAPERAVELYNDVRGQMVKMLTCDLIHGDLSPYNVLLAWNGPTLIDFPQVVGAAHNSQSEFFFRRDLTTIQRFFIALNPELDARHGDAQEIWRAYQRRELTADFVPKLVPKDRPANAGSNAGWRGPPHGRNHPPRPQGQQGQGQGQGQGNAQRPNDGGSRSTHRRSGQKPKGGNSHAVSYVGRPQGGPPQQGGGGPSHPGPGGASSTRPEGSPSQPQGDGKQFRRRRRRRR